MGKNGREKAIIELELYAAEVPFVGDDLDALDSGLSGEANRFQLASRGPLEAKARCVTSVSKKMQLFQVASTPFDICWG